MSFADWLDRTLAAGESVQAGPPGEIDAAARAVLRAAFARHAADVAGPPIAYDEAAAVAAAACLAAACWKCAGGDEGPPVAIDREPDTPAAHLSADVCLRLLPAVLRRGPAGHLADAVRAVLAAWPLSGAAADLPGPPSRLDFGGHPGLELLYAERLPAAPRPAWVPAGGRAREAVERVFAGRGRPLPEGTHDG